MPDPYISIIIPAHNESKRLGATLESVAEYLVRQAYVAEVIVVDNASSDNTFAVAESFSSRFGRLRVLREPQKGKGYAVATGMLAARGELRLFMDADSATNIDQLDRLMPFVGQGFGIVIGSIAVSGAEASKTEREPVWRVAAGKIGNLIIRLLAVPGIHDTQRGFKLFTVAAVNEIFPRLKTFGWGFDIEILAIARAQGYRVREVPIAWRHDPDSRLNLWAYPQVLKDSFKIAWRRITGRYKM